MLQIIAIPRQSVRSNVPARASRASSVMNTNGHRAIIARASTPSAVRARARDANASLAHHRASRRAILALARPRRRAPSRSIALDRFDSCSPRARVVSSASLAARARERAARSMSTPVDRARSHRGRSRATRGASECAARASTVDSTRHSSSRARAPTRARRVARARERAS